MSFFFRHLAGFFIQIGAGMLLSMIPFPKEMFRFPRKWVFAGYGALSFLFSSGFAIIMVMTVPLKLENLSPFANTYMFFAIVIFTFVYFWIVRAERIKKILVLILLIFYAATQYLLVNLVTPLFPGGTLPDVYPPLILALYAGTAAVLFPLTALFMRRAVRDYLAEMEIQNIRREFFTITLLTLLYFVMLMIYTSQPTGIIAYFWWGIIPPLLLATAILIVFYWSLFRESVRRKRENEQQKALDIQKLYYENITREMEQTKRMRHDMRHFLNHLSELLAQKNEEAMKDYLATLTVQVNHRDSTHYCKNIIVNGLLQYYVGAAADHHIRCKVTADCSDLTIDPVDLTVLFGNTMENAIHACDQVSEDRWITVQIGVFGSSMVMQVTNSCREIHPSGKYKLDENFLPAAAFVSNRSGGGYGLYSIEHTAEKYGGDAVFRFDEHAKTFTTRIRLNLHREIL